MRTTLLLIFSIVLVTSASAQYNPLWIRHCRAIPKKPEDYSKLAQILDAKIKRQSGDAEMSFLLGVCHIGSDQNSKATEVFNQVANDPQAGSGIKQDATNYLQYLRKRSSGKKIEILVNYTNTMKAPDPKAPLRGRVYKGDQFVVLKEQGDWVYIVNVENQGWVLKNKDSTAIIKEI